MLQGVQYIDTEAPRTATDRTYAVARYSDISSEADRGDIVIIHDQKFGYFQAVFVVTETNYKTLNVEMFT